MTKDHGERQADDNYPEDGAWAWFQLLGAARASAVALAGLAAVSAPATGENRAERWECGDLFLCGIAEDRDYNISLTADLDDGRGTVRLDDLPVQHAMFDVRGFERIWT